jgi:hypothetical protein
MKNRIDLIEFPVFSDFIVHVEVTKDIQKATQKYPSVACSVDEIDNNTDAVTLYANGKVCYIFLQPDASAGTVAHEAFHAVENMMSYFDMGLGGETSAYHIGYIVNRAFKLLRKR